MTKMLFESDIFNITDAASLYVGYMDLCGDIESHKPEWLTGIPWSI